MDTSLLNNPKISEGQNAAKGSASGGADVSGAEANAVPPAESNSSSPSGKGFGSKWLLYNVFLPLGILALGALTVVLIGSKAVPKVPPEDQSLAARIERLPDVDTLPVRSLESVGGFLELSVDGEVVPYREVQIATEVAGQVVYKDPVCEVGSFVSKGQLLFRIDPSDYQNEVERLTKLKEQEYQAIRELEQESVNTKRLIEVAASELELQEREIKRLKSLPAGYASQSELDQAQRSRLQALNSKVTLENQMDLMRQRRTRLEAAEQLAQTQLDMAKKNLERTEIRSPISGVIYREDAELNSFVQRGAVLITIEDTSKAEVVVNLRSDQLYWVLDQERETSSTDEPTSKDLTASSMAQNYSLPKTSATIQYALAGRENEVLQWDGTLERYDGIGFDPTSRTVPVRVVVDQPRRVKANVPNGSESPLLNGPSALVRGMFVKVILHVQPRKPLVVVPAVALKPGSTGNRVWKFQPDMSVLDQPVSDGPDASTMTDIAETTLAGAELPAVALTETDSKDNSGDDEAKKEEPKFNPQEWVVGRVEVLERIRPVEQVDVSGAQEKDGKLAVGSNGKANYWICEVGEGALRAGDRLIVSPLPSFEGKGRDGVRAPVE